MTMKLSNRLINQAEWWRAITDGNERDVDELWNKHASNHLNEAFPMYACLVEPDSIAYLCLLEAEYQKDIESYHEELAVHL